MEGIVGGDGDGTAEETDGFRPNNFKSSHTLKVSFRFRHCCVRQKPRLAVMMMKGGKGSHSTRKFQNPIFLFFRLTDLNLFGLGPTDTGNETTKHIFMFVKQKILGVD